MTLMNLQIVSQGQEQIQAQKDLLYWIAVYRKFIEQQNARLSVVKFTTKGRDNKFDLFGKVDTKLAALAKALEQRSVTEDNFLEFERLQRMTARIAHHGRHSTRTSLFVKLGFWIPESAKAYRKLEEKFSRRDPSVLYLGMPESPAEAKGDVLVTSKWWESLYATYISTLQKVSNVVAIEKNPAAAAQLQLPAAAAAPFYPQMAPNTVKKSTSIIFAKSYNKLRDEELGPPRMTHR